MTKPLCLLPSIPSHAGSTVAGEEVDRLEPRVLGEAREGGKGHTFHMISFLKINCYVLSHRITFECEMELWRY